MLNYGRKPPPPLSIIVPSMNVDASITDMVSVECITPTGIGTVRQSKDSTDGSSRLSSLFLCLGGSQHLTTTCRVVVGRSGAGQTHPRLLLSSHLMPYLTPNRARSVGVGVRQSAPRLRLRRVRLTARTARKRRGSIRSHLSGFEARLRLVWRYRARLRSDRPNLTIGRT
jgi:hypothetical protein